MTTGRFDLINRARDEGEFIVICLTRGDAENAAGVDLTDDQWVRVRGEFDKCLDMGDLWDFLESIVEQVVTTT